MGVCYRPPDSGRDFITELHKCLFQVTSLFPSATLVLLGDFNCPDIDWTALSSGSAFSDAFVDVCLDFNFSNVITQPTRTTKICSNVLDLCLTQEPDLISNVTYLPGISDHLVIELTLSLTTPHKSRYTKFIRNYAGADYSSINSQLEHFYDTFSHGFEERSVNANWTLYKDKLIQLIESFIPLTRVISDNNNPWYNKTIHKHSNKKKRLYRRAKCCDTLEAWNKYHDCATGYKTAINEAKTKFYTRDLSNILVNKPKKFWKIINPSTSSPLQFTDNSGHNLSDHQSALSLNNLFSSVFTEENLSNIPVPRQSLHTPMGPITFDYAGVLKAIENLKLSSSSGDDQINSKVLINTKHISAAFLCDIFSQSIKLSEIPRDWKTGNVTPVFKSGDRHLITNYRPISLTSVSSKLMEHVLYSNIINYLENNNLLFNHQHGFRKAYSCETQLTAFLHDIHAGFNTNIQTDAIFLDFSKAFDRVPHQRLKIKLNEFKIHPTIVNWISEFLTNRTQYTTINNSKSPSCPVTSGVPQGSVLGPLLFLIYINDIHEHISSSVRLFADDCVIYRPILSLDDHHTLQTDISQVIQWCNKWQMTLNFDKCKSLSFSRRALQPFSYHFDASPITVCSSYKYLGIHLTSDLSWTSHISNIVASANRTLGFLRRNLKPATAEIKQLAYSTLVRSKLEFASSVWCPWQSYLSNKLESIQNRALRFIFSDYSPFTSISGLREAANLHTLSLRRRVSRLSLLHRIFHYNMPLRESLLLPPWQIFPRFDHSCKLRPIFSSTTSYSNSTLPLAINDWNILPNDIVTITDTHKFAASVTTFISSLSD